MSIQNDEELAQALEAVAVCHIVVKCYECYACVERSS